jgi:hypothetical protein
MSTYQPKDPIDAFGIELLRTGVMVSGVAAEVIEALPPDAYPGEEPGDVVIEMMTGTIRTALIQAHESDVERATQLIMLARDRVIEHLELARKLATQPGFDG